MSFSERFVEFAPTADSNEAQGGSGDKAYRSTEQFIADAGIDVTADTERTGGTPRLCDLGGGATSELQFEAGANYWFSQLDYLRDEVYKGSRMTAEIPPGSRAEIAYWAKAAPEKQLTIHRGRGEIVLIDPADYAVKVVEFDSESEAILPPGVFYTFRARPESDVPFVLSGFYTEAVDWSTLEIVVQPGQTEIETPDGILQVPAEFQYGILPQWDDVADKALDLHLECVNIATDVENAALEEISRSLKVLSLDVFLKFNSQALGRSARAEPVDLGPGV